MITGTLDLPETTVARSQSQKANSSVLRVSWPNLPLNLYKNVHENQVKLNYAKGSLTILDLGLFLLLLL